MTRLTDHSPLPALPMEGSLPPDLQGTFLRIGPGAVEHRPDTEPGSGRSTPSDPVSDAPRGRLHAVELRDGRAVSYVRTDSDADAGVFWHAGAVVALAETGLPARYTRHLEPEAFTGNLTVPIASHVHRVAADGARVLFAVDDPADPDRGGLEPAGGRARAGGDDDGVVLRIGEWDGRGAFRAAQAVPLERATWQHDVGVTARHVVFVESPTRRLEGASGHGPVPFGWDPGGEGWLGVVPRKLDGGAVRWIRLDPCLVTHVLGATDVAGGDGDGGGGGGGGNDVVLYVCRYEAPFDGRPVDTATPVVGPAGIGLSSIGGNLAVLERWHVSGATVRRTQIDERFVEYPRIDAHREGGTFRFGYCVETRWASGSHGPTVAPSGILKVDLDRDDMTGWSPGPGRTAGEPVFVRANDGRSDEEGWLLTVVDDPDRGASDLYVLDASGLGRRRPEAIVHLPERLPFRSHGEWVAADKYR